MPVRREHRGRQLVLDLSRDPSFAPDQFLVAPENAKAHAMIQAWPDWPDRALLLIGPVGSGKSHLAAIWACRAGARALEPDTIRELAVAHQGAAAVLEDVDRMRTDEADLFHLLNMIRNGGGWLLITARSPADLWGLRTPDLLSRLRLAPTVTIDPPDYLTIKSVIVKLFADRQIAIDDDVVTYAARHCEQSLDAANRFVAAVDEEALASGRRITRPLATEILSRYDADFAET